MNTMKSLLVRFTFHAAFLIAASIVASCGTADEVAVTTSPNCLMDTDWELEWSDEFAGDTLDGEKWDRCERGSPDWRNTMSDDPRLLEVEEERKYGPEINRDDWNTYGCHWDADKVDFTVNGQPTHTYPRIPEKGEKQWPFNQPFYFILSMQIGGNWVNGSGSTNPSHYPAGMEVDWIRVCSCKLRPADS